MTSLLYKIGRPEEIEQQMLDFRDGISRTVAERVRLGLVLMKLPVFDDAPYRIFSTMEEYRLWAECHLPPYLGFTRPHD